MIFVHNFSRATLIKLAAILISVSVYSQSFPPDTSYFRAIGLIHINQPDSALVIFENLGIKYANNPVYINEIAFEFLKFNYPEIAANFLFKNQSPTTLITDYKHDTLFFPFHQSKNKPNESSEYFLYQKSKSYLENSGYFNSSFTLNIDFENFNKGIKLSDKKEILEADEYFRNQIEINPQKSLNYYGLAYNYKAEGDYSSASRNIIKAIELEPGISDYYFLYYQVLNKQNKIKKALEQIELALNYNPFNVIYIREKSHTLSQLGTFTNNESIFLSAAYSLPTNDSLWVNAGKAAFASHDFRKAINYYSVAIKQNPLNTQAYYEKALTYLEIQEFDSAEMDICMIIDLDPKNAKAYLAKGFLLFDKGDLKQACSCFLKSQKLGNDMPSEFKKKCKENGY